METTPQLLATLGVSTVPGPILIPLYCRKKLVPVPEPRLPMFTVLEVAEVDQGVQECVSLLLQVLNGMMFRR
jgi:hypothetical protein